MTCVFLVLVKDGNAQDEDAAADDATSDDESDAEAPKKSDSSDETSDSDSDADEPNTKWSLSVKMRGIPFRCTEQQILTFFSPIKVLDIRMPLNDEKKVKGVAYVDFENEESVRDAMKRNTKNIKGRYIELFRIEQEKSFAESSTVPNGDLPWKNKVSFYCFFQ